MQYTFKKEDARSFLLAYENEELSSILLGLLEKAIDDIDHPIDVMMDNDEIIGIQFSSMQEIEDLLETKTHLIEVHTQNGETVAWIEEKNMNTNTKEDSKLDKIEDKLHELHQKMDELKTSIDQVKVATSKVAADKPSTSSEKSELVETIKTGLIYAAGTAAVVGGGWFLWNRLTRQDAPPPGV